MEALLMEMVKKNGGIGIALVVLAFFCRYLSKKVDEIQKRSEKNHTQTMRKLESIDKHSVQIENTQREMQRLSEHNILQDTRIEANKDNIHHLRGKIVTVDTVELLINSKLGR